MIDSRVRIIFLMSSALALLVGVSLSLGPGGFSWVDGELFAIRAFRVVAAVVVGASLSVGGVMLQSLMRNSLASPDLLGIASGSGLAMSLASLLGGWLIGGGFVAATVAAWVGAALTLALVFALSHRGRRLEPATVILVGVMVGIIAASLTQLIQQIMPPEQGRAAANALLGGIRENEVGWTQLLVVAILALAAIAGACALGPAMDVASLSDDEATSVGVSLPRLRAAIFVLSGVLTAGSVVLAGPVGFVGLVCPHVSRVWGGPSHRLLVVRSALAGAALVVGADLLIRLIAIESGRLPLSVVTACVGGPVLIQMLRRKSQVF